MLRFSILTENVHLYLEGFKYTIGASVIALIGSFLIGTLIAIMRIAPFRPLNWFGTAYVEFIRNIPLLLITFVFFFGLPVLGIVADGFTAGTIALAIYTSAFIAEAIRAGIQAVPLGQMEAARASGLSYGGTMRYIILPQAIKIVIPLLEINLLTLSKTPRF